MNNSTTTGNEPKPACDVAETVADLIVFAKKAENKFRQQLSADEEIVTLDKTRILYHRMAIPETMHAFIWFRGQPLRGEGLIPKVQRSAFRHISDNEYYYLNQFMVLAPSRHPENVPQTDDYANWLALAQHHGLPTRLLDSSASVLTAAFFAAGKCPNPGEDRDGVIYAASPALINSEFGEYKLHNTPVLELVDPTAIINERHLTLMTPTDREHAIIYARDHRSSENPINFIDLMLRCAQSEITELIIGAFSARRIQSKNAPPVTPQDQSKKILAVMPRQETRRIMQQHGAFTIHSRESERLDQAKNSNNFLTQITIPVERKAQIREELRLLGVTRSQLFPDLDNLAREISEPRE